MRGTRRTTAAAIAAGLAACAGALVAGEDEPPTTDPKAEQMELPKGWTEADMEACTLAGTPGEQHARLAQDAGEWRGTGTMWMAEGAEPMTNQTVFIITPVMDGRYLKVESRGEMPGMGEVRCDGIVGYDNVAQQHVASWWSSMSTGVMHGTGEASSDGKTITWTYTVHCPIRKGETTMRDVQRHVTPDHMTYTTYATDPKTGNEFKMAHVEVRRVKAVGGARAD